MTTATPQRKSEASPTTESMPRRLVATATGEGPAYWFFDCLAIVRTSETSLPIIIEMTVPSGGGAPLHVHENLDDSFYLATGRVVIECGDDRLVAEAGDYVSMPHGVPHRFLVVGEKPAVMMQVHTDDSFLRFIKSVGKPAPSRTLPPSDQRMDLDVAFKVAAETGQPVIGPPMSPEEAAEIVRNTTR
jgi:mannose-6-phosphate isomerase-like protein (cupin superfamily)